MIEVSEKDIGRRVVYYFGKEPFSLPCEYGTVTSLNEKYVFVLYDGDIYSKATRPADLEWVT